MCVGVAKSVKVSKAAASRPSASATPTAEIRSVPFAFIAKLGIGLSLSLSSPRLTRGDSLSLVLGRPAGSAVVEGEGRCQSYAIGKLCIGNYGELGEAAERRKKSIV